MPLKEMGNAEHIISQFEKSICMMICDKEVALLHHRKKYIYNSLATSFESNARRRIAIPSFMFNVLIRVVMLIYCCIAISN